MSEFRERMRREIKPVVIRGTLGWGNRKAGALALIAAAAARWSWLRWWVPVPLASVGRRQT